MIPGAKGQNPHELAHKLIGFDLNTILFKVQSGGNSMKKYDVIIIGAGPGGIFSAYELLKNNENLKIAIFEEGHALEKRKCPIDGKRSKAAFTARAVRS